MLNKTLEPWHLRLCLAAVALMVTVPFLMAHHYNPITSFFQEWTCVALSMMALTALLIRTRDNVLEIPEIALLPLGLLGIASLQWFFQPDALKDRLLMFGCNMAWATGLIVLGRHLTRSVGLQSITIFLAFAVLIGALFEAVSAGCQLLNIARLPWCFPFTGGGLKGNLAQNNNFSDYLWLGVASAIYLRSQKRLGRISTLAAFSLLLPFAILSGSRSVWLYGALTLCVSGLWFGKARSNETGTMLRWSIAALCGSLLIQIALSANWLSLREGITTSGTRLASEGANDSIRFTLWRVALNTFLEQPWLGAGFGQYTRQFHLHILDYSSVYRFTLPEHAHNILLHLLAEMGLFGGLLLLCLGGRFIISLIRRAGDRNIFWIAACIAILGIHSCLEYPLWYAFFLGFAAFLLGAASDRNWSLSVRPLWPHAIAVTIAAGTVIIYNLHKDYSLLEDTANWRNAHVGPQEFRRQSVETLQQLARESMLRSHIELTLVGLAEESADEIESKLASCDRAQRFSASQDIVFKCAHLLYIGGYTEDAKLALRRAVAAYPDKAKVIQKQWAQRSNQEATLKSLMSEFEYTDSAKL